MAGSKGRCMLNYLRNFQIFFKLVPSYIPSTDAQEFPWLLALTTLCIAELFYFGPASWGVWWFLFMVLSHLSLVISDVEHLFMCCSAMQASSFVRCLFKPFTRLVGLSAYY